MLPLMASTVPNGTFAPLDLSDVYLHNAQFTGTSGSTLDDQATHDRQERVPGRTGERRDHDVTVLQRRQCLGDIVHHPSTPDDRFSSDARAGE